MAITERRTRADIDRLARGRWRGERGASVEPRERRDGDDLRAVARGPARVHAARDGRARGAGRRSCCPASRSASGPPSCPRSPSPRSCATTDAVEEELRPRHGLLPARLVHDEAQPEAARAGGGAARPRAPAPAPGPRVRAGRARADVAPPGRAVGDRRAAARVAPAERRLARRAGRPAADARLPRGPRRAAHQGADARHRARHQPGDGDDGRLRGGEGRHRRATAASTSTTCARRRPTTSPA